MEHMTLLKLAAGSVAVLGVAGLLAIHLHNQRRLPVAPLERDASALSHATRTLVVYFTRSGRTRSLAEGGHGSGVEALCITGPEEPLHILLGP